jgi:hypothetical protein
LLVTIRLHQRTPGDGGPDSYLDSAKREWNWFKQSGMINDQHLVNDGLDENCENNRRMTWTYNQGVLIGGLVELFKSTGETNALIEAGGVADAAANKLVNSQGVLRELSEWRGLSGDDVPQFKGIFMRHLAELYDVCRKPEYRALLVGNAGSVWRNNRDSQNRLGGIWSGPVDTVDPIRQSSAMRVITALAEPVTTNVSFVRSAGSPVFQHETGVASGAAAWKGGNSGHSGYLLIGPQVASLGAGTHTMHCRLAVNSLSNVQANLVRMDILGNGAAAPLASRAVAWSEFAQTNQAQDFSLVFTSFTDKTPVQFRLYWYGAAGSPDLIVTDVWADAPLCWSAAALDHEVGQFDRFDHWCADPVRNKTPGYLVRGPGTELPAGEYDVCFELKVDNFNRDDSTVATLSVVDADSGKTLSGRDIRRREFANVLYRAFMLRVKAPAGKRLDFRTFWHAQPAAPRLTQRCVLVKPVPALH